nr:MAG TPA: hypothetical protein [Caudoviricetes sp.]
MQFAGTYLKRYESIYRNKKHVYCQCDLFLYLLNDIFKLIITVMIALILADTQRKR